MGADIEALNHLTRLNSGLKMPNRSTQIDAEAPPLRTSSPEKEPPSAG